MRLLLQQASEILDRIWRRPERRLSSRRVWAAEKPPLLGLSPLASLLPCLALAVVTFVAGCASHHTRKVIDLAPFKRIYVVQRLGDDHRLNEFFVAALRAHGHTATTGPRTMIPDDADAVLTYTDRWEWDFKNYLIELNLEVHTARTTKKLADGRYFQPTPKPKPAEQVVRELVASLLAK